MRRLLLVGLFALLPGCAIIDAYLMTKYDSNEYRIITEIRADSAHAKSDCDNAQLSKANASAVGSKTEMFVLYSQYIPRNSNGISASKSLNEMAQGLVDRYKATGPVSPAFCRIKFNAIEHSAELIQHTIGNRPR